MEVAIAAIGRLKAGPERELCERYLDRARKAGSKLGLRGFEVHEAPESRAARPADRMAQEGEAILARIGGEARLVSLDAAGDPIDSQEFARNLSRDAAASVQRTVFVIGGADGLGKLILGRSERIFSFGRMTLPHQLVRVLLAEQLYRAVTMLSGHPYHRA